MVNWTNHPDIEKQLVDWHYDGMSYKEISEMLATRYPTFRNDPPTRDSIKNAVKRAKDKYFKVVEDDGWEPNATAEELLAKGQFIGLRTLYVDIEATDLGAAFGHVLCASFADELGNVETYRIDDPRFKGRNIVDDSRLVAAIRDRMEKVDLVVGHNFRLYDKAFLNARLTRPVPGYPFGQRTINSSLKISDTLFLAGGQNMRLGSRRLDTLAKYFKLPVQKTPLDGEIWQLAGAGDKDAMDLVVEHCEHDVLVERAVYAYLKQFAVVLHR